MHKMFYDYHPSLIKISMPMDLPALPEKPDSKQASKNNKVNPA